MIIKIKEGMRLKEKRVCDVCRKRDVVFTALHVIQKKPIELCAAHADLLTKTGTIKNLKSIKEQSHGKQERSR